MAEDVVMVTNEPATNPCCAELKKQYLKLQEKYSKLELRRNALREGISMVNEKFDLIEKENKVLKQALEGLKLQASKEKNEKEKESSLRVSLENEILSLKAELLSLQQNGNSAAQVADRTASQLKESLAAADSEIRRLKELLDKEIARADFEKKNADMEKKKVDEVMKKINAEKDKVTKAKKLAEIERKKAEESRRQLEKLKTETDEAKSELASIMSKIEAANMKVEKDKGIKAKKLADIERKKAEESRLQLEKLKTETNEAKSELASIMSKIEAANMKVESERQNTIQQRKRADLAMAKVEDLKKLSEMNLKKAMDEKGRGQELSRKLVEERKKVEKLEKDICELMSSRMQTTARNVEGKCEHCLETMTARGLTYEGLEKKLMESEHKITREKKRVDSEMKKAEKQRKIAEAHKKDAVNEKNRAEQLSRELDDKKKGIEQLQNELQELVLCRKFTNFPPSDGSKVISETSTTKLLKKQLKFEKKLVKYANKIAQAEIVRSNMLRQELFQLKQESLQFQQRLDTLNDSFLRNEGINEVEKIDKSGFTRKHFEWDRNRVKYDGKNELVPKPSSMTSTLVWDAEPLKENIEHDASCHPLYLSGIDSKLEPLCRVSNRKMLPTSAINSSLASFSDRPLGSQDRGDISFTTSAKLSEYASNDSNLEPPMSRLSGETIKRYNPNCAATAEDGARSPIKGNDTKRGAGHSKKRKKTVEAFESIENLYSKGKKLHGIVGGQKDEPLEGDRQGNSCRKHVRCHKKRKSSFDETTAIHHIHDGQGKHLINNLEIEELHELPPVFSNLAQADRDRKEGMGNTLPSNQYIALNFEELTNHDHMKLLDLDNDVDEKSYRAAIAAPLSPTLPEIEFEENEALGGDNSKLLVEVSIHEGSSNLKDDLTPSCTDALDVKMDSDKLKHGGFCTSQLHINEYRADSPKIPAANEDGNLDVANLSNACLHQINSLGKKLGISDKSDSGNKKSTLLSENMVALACSSGPRYCVVSSANNDNSSIRRIIRTVDCYVSQNSLLFSADSFLPSIRLALLKADGLSAEEKVSVFFSLLLHGISEGEVKDFMNFISNDSVASLDSFCGRLLAVLSDVDFRRIFTESCDLLELLDLAQDFLLQRKVLVCGDLSSESVLKSIPETNPVMTDNVKMSVEAASSHLLVAGAILLTLLCKAVDHIGFVCETSCNILMMEKFDTSVLLTVLHVFAHVCGSKYFHIDQYSVAMTVVRSLVLSLEKQNRSTGSPLSPFLVGSPSNIWSCSKCPFSEGAISMDGIASLLLDKLQKYAGACVWPEDSYQIINMLVPELWSHKEKADEVKIRGETALSNSTSHENLHDLVDILSLIELVAFFMGWNWAFDKIVCRLLVLLEAHVMGWLPITIVTLLDQLGRLGINTGGYEDAGVEKLRDWLSSFMCSASEKLSIPLQFAVVNALSVIVPIKFEELIGKKDHTMATTSESNAANCVRKWFFLLTGEQQSSFMLQQTARMTNCNFSLPKWFDSTSEIKA